VHTFSLLTVPFTMTRIRWMFGFQRRRVSRCECEMLLPKPGFFPQISQTDDIAAKVTPRWRVPKGDDRWQRRTWTSDHSPGTASADTSVERVPALG